MKKVLLILVMALALMSCTKENEDCNCGLIVSDDGWDYSVIIRNSCSGHEKKFILSEGDWFNAHPGNDYCITNSTGW